MQSIAKVNPFRRNDDRNSVLSPNPDSTLASRSASNGYLVVIASQRYDCFTIPAECGLGTARVLMIAYETLANGYPARSNRKDRRTARSEESADADHRRLDSRYRLRKLVAAGRAPPTAQGPQPGTAGALPGGTITKWVNEEGGVAFRLEV